jgi:RimJ/RimL family protein N-acetyltransferase
MLVVLKSTHEVIGSVGYWIDEDGDYSIDYDFNPKFWNKGYATEAAREVVRYLKDDKGVKEIYGDCDARNTASSRVLERLGFQMLFTDENASYKNDKDGNPIRITVNVYKLEF